MRLVETGGDEERAASVFFDQANGFRRDPSVRLIGSVAAIDCRLQSEAFNV